VRFRDEAFRQLGNDRWIWHWRWLSGLFAGYFATMAFLFGLHGREPQFDANALIAGLYVYSCGKSHSAVTRLRRRRYND
jgi:hypothetical protein